MSKFVGSMFKKSRRYGISLLENNKEFTKAKNVQLPLDNTEQKEANHQTINYTCMKNKKLDICMV